MLRPLLIAGTILLAHGPALADEDGTLNPEEMSLGSVMERAVRGQVDMVTCAQGYFITKSGRHATVRNAEATRPVQHRRSLLKACSQALPDRVGISAPPRWPAGCRVDGAWPLET